MGRLSIPVLFGAFLAVCCAPPAGVEEFIPASQSKSGTYTFPLDLSDSLAYYDIVLYTRSDNPKAGKDDFLPVDVHWFSPDSLLQHTERIALPTGGWRGKVSVYREDVRLRPSGVWLLMLHHKPDEAPIRGMGLSLKKHSKPHGTR